VTRKLGVFVRFRAPLNLEFAGLLHIHSGQAFAYPLKLNQYRIIAANIYRFNTSSATSNSLLFSFTIADINLRDILSSSAANIF
jgi:hypothetical protein